MCCCGCCNRFTGFFKDICGAMSLDETRQSQRPYRYGMVLLCIGALINWLGLAENYVEPVRYIGVACIIAGALLICAAMCCWLQAPAPSTPTHQTDDPIQVITVPDEETMQQKPPDYDSVAGAPPTYDDAIKLNPAHLRTQIPGVHGSPELPPPPPLRRTSGPGLRNSRRSSRALSAATINALLTPPGVSTRETIPGQLENVITEHIPIPKSPPPPYRQVRSIR